MTEAVKEVAQAIRESKPTDMHPDLHRTLWLRNFMGKYYNE